MIGSVRLTNRERTNMDFGRDNALSEINDVLDNEIMTAEQLLGELMLSMGTQELKENWDHIKRMWDLDQVLGDANIDEGDLIATAC